MGSELTTTNQEVGLSVPPEMVLGNAQIAAKALGEVLKNKPKPVIINKEQYLEYEDWQTLGQFYGYTVKTGAAEMVDIDGVKGAKASASLIDIHTGLFLGGAEAYCMRDEEKWGTRAKYEWQGSGNSSHRVKIGEESVPWFQLASMAQTRAGAKAFRNRLAWVVVMAGFKATPVEEMTESRVSPAVQERRTVDDAAHWCTKHNTAFFKKGRMKGYSHPIEGTDPPEWCNEADAPPPVKASAPLKDEPLPPLPADEYIIDMTWLKESIEALVWKDYRTWLSDKFTIPTDKAAIMIAGMTSDQRREFVAEIEGRLNDIEPPF